MKRKITHDAAVEELYKGGALGFSYAGAEALVNRIEDYEDDSGIEFELDPVALACQFMELSAEELIDEYGYLVDIDALLDAEESTGYIADRIADVLRDDDEVIQFGEEPYTYIIGGF